MAPEPQHASPEAARWKVLLVDDEPEVHEVSRLILAGLSFEGRDIELLSAGSAAQARELLSQQRDVALALLDIVMETDDAGITLVQHIREQLHDKDMQIVLRTGQPGVAPEGDIVRRYEINGYVLKTEITAQRLHSIVISALRSYRHTRSLRNAPQRGLQSELPRKPDAMRHALGIELNNPVDLRARRLFKSQLPHFQSLFERLARHFSGGKLYKPNVITRGDRGNLLRRKFCRNEEWHIAWLD